jgi:hypothetical protein
MIRSNRVNVVHCHANCALKIAGQVLHSLYDSDRSKCAIFAYTVFMTSILNRDGLNNKTINRFVCSPGDLSFPKVKCLILLETNLIPAATYFKLLALFPNLGKIVLFHDINHVTDRVQKDTSVISAFNCHDLPSTITIDRC